MFDKVLIANRGEIAVRIARACQAAGLRTVLFHSDADSKSLAARTADETYRVAGNSPLETYLNIPLILEAASQAGCQAVHPGYGFLAESASFARAVEDAGFVFIGPSHEAIASMGDKATARRIATTVGVPLVPGTAPIAGDEEAASFAQEHGYPVVVKASNGGGGRGMRVIDGPAAVRDAVETARREAAAAFGSSDVYLERYLTDARHVELQVVADRSGDVICIGDRDCSVQRRHQKLMEEAPAPLIAGPVRRRMAEAAVRLARAVRYRGVGTVEFLLHEEDFYFLEMNTRIQVEHSVTEMAFDVDLVREQLDIARGLLIRQDLREKVAVGHAIECRLNAEEVVAGQFIPQAGVIQKLQVPEGIGIRFDSGYESGDILPGYYDSLIGKVIVLKESREAAVASMTEVLDGVQVNGIPTTLPALRRIIMNPEFIAGPVSTRWLEDVLLVGPGIDSAPLLEDNEVVVNGRVYHVPVVASVPNISPMALPPHVNRPRRLSAAHPSRQRNTMGPEVRCPMHGTVAQVYVRVGDRVSIDTSLLTVEAMKMEFPVFAMTSGTVTEVRVSEGDTVPVGELLVMLELA